MNSYHNTNHEGGDTLKKSEAKAMRQEDEILAFIQFRYPQQITPEYAWEYSGMKDRNIPLTSVRRSFTNLHRQGKIVKSTHMVKGMYGKMIHTWTIITPFVKPEQLSLIELANG
jgi:hypothetical protein